MRFSDLWKAALLVCAGTLFALAAEPQDPFASPQKPDLQDPRAHATHQQTAIIKIVDDQGATLPLHTFCLDRQGRILAGVGQQAGELRVFDPDGKFLAAWKLAVKPEAVTTGADGSVYVAGDGQLLKLDDAGKLLLQKEAPHAAALKADPNKVREDVIAQAKQRAESFGQAIKSYEQQVERVKKQIEKLSAKDDSDKKADGEPQGTAEQPDEAQRKAAAEKRAAAKEQQLASQKRTLEALEKQVQALQDYLKQMPAELTEAQIQQQVQANLKSKLRMASITISGSDVFVTCAALAGYGYDVWRTDAQFGGAEKIVGDLRGCCGQMDVQASADGVFIAENGRFLVRRLDRDGKALNEWGKSARQGLDGFGGCCNPMNVACGPSGEVYTSESETGRIKRFSPAGELLGFIGQADLVPGCKKVTIAVNQDGSRVYMLDITRTHIVLMTKKPVAPPTSTAQAAK
jgi:sugar lactone lactonase YvrE